MEGSNVRIGSWVREGGREAGRIVPSLEIRLHSSAAFFEAVKTTHVFGRPQDDHPFEERSARARAGDEEIEVRAGDVVWRILAHLDAVFRRRDFEEAHLTPNVIQGTNQQVEGSGHRVELRVECRRQPDLCNHRADKLHVAPRVMTILHHPLCEGPRGECAATGMGQEGLLRRGGERRSVGAQQMRREGRRELAVAPQRCPRRIHRLPVAIPLVLIRAAPMDLEVRIGCMSVQDCARCVVVERAVQCLCAQMRLRVCRVEVRRALLEMLNLARRVFRPHETAVETSYFIAL